MLRKLLIVASLPLPVVATAAEEKKIEGDEREKFMSESLKG
jgi:hypothetical protein